MKKQNPRNEPLLRRLKIVKDYEGYDHDFYKDDDANILTYWVFFDKIPDNIKYLLKAIKNLKKEDVNKADAIKAFKELEKKKLAVFSINLNNNKIYRARVNKYVQHNGIASFMYDYIEKDLGIKIEPDIGNQTADGIAFWEYRKRMKRNPVIKRMKINPNHDQGYSLWLKEQFEKIEYLKTLIKDERLSPEAQNRISYLLQQLIYTVDSMIPKVTVDTFDYDAYNRENEERRRRERIEELRRRQIQSGMIKKK